MTGTVAIDGGRFPFRRGLASSFVTDVVARSLSAITTIILIRELPVADYAFIVLFFAVGQFLGASATGGLRTRYLRTEAESVSRGIPSSRGFLSAACGGLLLIAGVGVLAVIAGTVFDIGSPSNRFLFIILCVGFSAGQAVLELATAHYQASLAFLRGGLVSIGRTLSLLVAACVATVIFSASGEVTAVILVILTGAVAAGVTFSIVRRTPMSRRGSRASSLGFDAEARWLTVYSLVAAGFATVDVFIVATILNGYDVAAFGAAQRYYAVALGAAGALEAVLRVRTSQCDVVDSREAQILTLRNWLRRATIPATVLTGGLAALSPIAIPLIDQGRYPVSIPVFQILLVGALAYYLAMPGVNVLMAQRRFRMLGLLFGAALVVNTVGDYAFGKVIGLVGIAAVAAITLVALSVAEIVLAFHGARAASASESTVSGRRPVTELPSRAVAQTAWLTSEAELVD